MSPSRFQEADKEREKESEDAIEQPEQEQKASEAAVPGEPEKENAKPEPTEAKVPEKKEQPEKSMGDLRSEYQKLHPENKRPFNGWDEEQLKEKIAGFKNK